MTSWIRNHPLFAYFVLAFGISWSGIGIIAASTHFDLAAPQPLATGLFFVAMLLGPSVSGLVLTALLRGSEGLRDLGARLKRWRVGGFWYSVALVTAPLILITILYSLSLGLGPAFTPNFKLALLGVGFIAGAFEEIGWTGFATPRLLARRSVGMAGLQLGVTWALWHALVVFLFTFAAMGGTWIWSFIIIYLLTLTPYRILMTWVYANTQSVLLAACMHASYTGSLLALFPSTSPAQSLVWQAVFAAALWTAALVALRASPNSIARRLAVPVAPQIKETLHDHR